MSETSIKQNSLCLICGLRGTHDIYLTSGQSTVSATGTQLGKFLYKIISEEPCYSISEVICEQCYLLLDRLDTYQARAAEINLHISDRYKDTKLGLIGCKRRISDLIVNSLSNIKSFKNGTTLNVSDELSVTVFHEALPRTVNNKGIVKSVVVSPQQKEFRQTSHLKQFNSDFLRCRTKKSLFIHNLIRSKQIYKKNCQLYKVANKSAFLKKKLTTDVKYNYNRPRPNVKRKLSICLKENSAPKKLNNNLITNVSKNIRTNFAKFNDPDDLSSVPVSNLHKTDKINVKKINRKYIDKTCENYENSVAKGKCLDTTVTSCKSESLNSNNLVSQIDIHNQVSKSNNLHQISSQKSVNESNKMPLLNRSNSEEERVLGRAAKENIDCEDHEENTQNGTSSGSNCSSSSSSSNDSSSSCSSDSSSDDSSSSTEYNSSDDEEQKDDSKTDINSDSNICDENIKNVATNLESNMTDNSVEVQSERASNIIKMEAPNDAGKEDLAGSDICGQIISKNVKTTKSNSFSSPSKQIKAQESKSSKNISEVVDSMDPQFSQAAWMQNSLASSLLQSFLSTSLWMNSSGSPNKNSMNSQNQDKLEDGQNSNDMASELLPNTVGSINDKQKRIELKNTGQSYINTKGKLVEAKRVSPQDCSRCPLRCNGRLNDEKRQAIFADYWGLADYNLQREYLASHMDREERMGPSGITRNVILYYLTYNEAKVQVCRQFFLKTLDISEKASRLVIEKRLKS